MKLLFVDNIAWDYNVESVYQRPLGGSQSALCYLAEALARRGHHVSFATNTTQPGLVRGVHCLTISKTTSAFLQSLAPDACIVLNGGVAPEGLRKLIGPDLFVVLWTQHAPNQPQVANLADPAIRGGYNYIAFVSDWQRAVFIPYFSIEPEKAVVLRNAVAPVFEGMFPPTANRSLRKSEPPVLVYTSTPFRGLDLLLQVFPEIRKAVPNTRLKVFSSMKVYQFSDTADEQQYGALYRACHETEGVEYCGSLPQHQLAGELKLATALAYPNTYAETSCIAVMEAMAVGCGIITSDLGALSETAAGFATLLSPDSERPEYIKNFRDATITFLKKSLNHQDRDFENQLFRQVDFVNANYTWTKRAEEWETWLTNHLHQRAGQP